MRELKRAGRSLAWSLSLSGGLLGVLMSAMPVASAIAGPNDYIRLPTVESGEREIDFKYGQQRNRDGSTEAANSLGYGVGVNNYWFTEIYAKYKQAPGESTTFDAWECENRFQLTETGQYAVDVGFLLEIERPLDRTEGYEVTWGPLFQKEWGRWQGNFNVLVQQHVLADAKFDTELLYQAQLKYRAQEKLEWGMQAFGNLGQWDNWRASALQEHKIGPAMFGKFKTGMKQAIKWNAAWLFGLTDATPGTTLRLQTEYEF